LIVLLSFGVCAANKVEAPSRASEVPTHVLPPPEARGSGADHVRSDADTTWIFDADFEDLTGDNWGIHDLGQPGDSLTGWYTQDRSGTALPIENHWHLDTLNSYKDGTPPDSSMWCGTCNHSCSASWIQQCGYGNNWTDYLTLEIDLTGYSLLELSFRQIFAMEHDYDYGYVDVSTDDGQSWVTKAYYHNPGFAEQPGIRQFDWDGAVNHPTIDLMPIGEPTIIRWRFESDGGLSSKDYEDIPPSYAVTDGAWYIDEVEITAGGVLTVFEEDFDDGDDGWVHDPIPGENQVGAVFRRAYAPTTGLGFDCQYPGGWMLVATDSLLNRRVDYQICRLTAPSVDISGAH
jgi:hypothetical protein